MDVLNLSLGGPQIDPVGRCARRWRSPMRRAPASPPSSPRATTSTRAATARSPRRARARRRSPSPRPRRTRVFGVSGRVSGAGSPGARAVHRGAVDRAARDARRSRSPTRLVVAPRPTASTGAAAASRRGAAPLRAVVIVLRGGCSFGTKAINAHEAGARAVIVESDRPGPPFVVEEEADLPLLVVTDVVGRELRAYVAARGRAPRACASPATIAELPTPPRVLTDFSSAGPDALRPPAQARHRRAGGGDPLVDPAGLARLSRRVRLVGGHLDGGAGGHGRRRARCASAIRTGRPRRSARR